MNKILIVEDEQSIAEMVKLCLCKNGYMCEIVNDGMAATQKIEEKRYDLILLDIMLPDIDGYDLIEYIKQFDIPVIFVTAKTSVPDRVKGLKLGAEDYISKPFDLEELLARVATVLRRFHKTDNILEVGKIKIDTLEHTVLLDGELVVLPAKSFENIILDNEIEITMKIKGSGTFLASFLLVFSAVAAKQTSLVKMSPVSWSTLNYIQLKPNDGLPSYGYITAFYMIMLLVLFVIILYSSKRYNFDKELKR